MLSLDLYYQTDFFTRMRGLEHHVRRWRRLIAL